MPTEEAMKKYYEEYNKFLYKLFYKTEEFIEEIEESQWPKEIKYGENDF